MKSATDVYLNLNGLRGLTRQGEKAVYSRMDMKAMLYLRKAGKK